MSDKKPTESDANGALNTIINFLGIDSGKLVETLGSKIADRINKGEIDYNQVVVICGNKIDYLVGIYIIVPIIAIFVVGAICFVLLALLNMAFNGLENFQDWVEETWQSFSDEEILMNNASKAATGGSNVVNKVVWIGGGSNSANSLRG
ncbi:hypothetical protein BBBOND_0400980 [Babesia bigemina]|uniref:Uncharacterized protein n=1 Tax=Babesia bigemina TaxID=5866 RepID=A0A061DA65_BABBI|nr:hypothetical protein BBBOND_0400980 [Babesia bigemina]CDR97606.1 hypothetical protein BBBOND_0400980 [Babesia bigemina]|eukprot:XP_012769792.1 hypothetical protein BBBOND_0400980 [Babesia bigemina]